MMTDSKINYYITVKCSLFFLCTRYIQKKAPEAFRGFIFFFILNFDARSSEESPDGRSDLTKVPLKIGFDASLPQYVFISSCLEVIQETVLLIKKTPKKQQKTDFHNFY